MCILQHILIIGIKVELSEEIEIAKREIDVFRILEKDDKHLVKLVEGFADGQYYFLVMEYCSEGDFASLLKRYGKLSSMVLDILFFFSFLLLFSFLASLKTCITCWKRFKISAQKKYNPQRFKTR
jgi:serine/threonine protein kinase